MLNYHQKLLFSYYNISFSKLLDIEFLYDKIHYENIVCLKEYINNNYPNFKAHDTKTKLKTYQIQIAPFCKSQPLLQFLYNYSRTIENLIDFGCGFGHFLNYLINNLATLQNVVGIDTDEIALSKCTVKNPNVLLCSNLSEAKIHINSFDLITAVHTFHHINKDEHVKILSQFNKLLIPDGILYIYEDSWSTNFSTTWKELKNIDDKFLNLTASQKLDLYLLNEYWSNCWCYERNMNFDQVFYLTLREWIDTLVYSSFNILSIGIIGFDIRRLHGVPSVWIIAKPANK